MSTSITTRNGKTVVSVDGKEVAFQGNINSLQVSNGDIIIDGKKWEGTEEEMKVMNHPAITVIVQGNVEGDIDTQGPVEVTGDVEGSVNSQGRVTCGKVRGDVRTQGQVAVRGDLGGNINTMGKVTVEGDVQGTIHTMGKVYYGGKKVLGKG